MKQFERLFEPIRIGEFEVKNRIESAPTLPILATPDGYVTRELIDYYKAKARGGAGIVTVGESAVDDTYAKTHAGQLIIHHDKVIPGLCELAEAIKRYGAKASLELCHGGRQTTPHAIDGRNPIAPSPMPSKFHEMLAGQRITVQEMTAKMIEEVMENFAAAAHRLLLAGFDMTLIHGGHGWLLAQFLSPLTNRRTDSYGGSFQNRARFPIELLTRIRERVGNDLAIEYRMSGDELVTGGLRQEEAVAFAKMIENKVDCIQVSAGMISEPATLPYTHPPTYLPHAHNVHLAERIKKAVTIPVTCVGAITDLELAEKIVVEGKADIVAMARALVADPELPNKSYHGRLDEVIPCIRCNDCLGRVAHSLPVRCAVNPIIGRETEFSYIRPTEQKKRVLIVGGGPAGMEAAIVAASRGHEVALYEKTEELGGNLSVASMPPFKDDMKKFRDYMVKRVQQLSVDVKLSTEPTAEAVKAINPEVMVLAVGAEPTTPDIPGATKSHVVWAGDVFTGNADLGKHVVVAGGNLIGCETALYLAKQGKKVVIIDVLDDVATDASVINKILLVELLDREGVEIKTEVKLDEVTEQGTVVIDRQWQRHEISADTVVLAMTLRPRTETVKALKGLVPEVYTIGDCSKPRNVLAAVHDGFNVAVEI